jgi:hypothetical protein
MSHPYERFEGSPLWAAIEAEIHALAANGDLALTTAPAYVIGALCARIESENLLGSAAPESEGATLLAVLDAAAAGSRHGDWQRGIARHYANPLLEEVRRQAALTALRLDQGSIRQEQAETYFAALARRLRETAG